MPSAPTHIGAYRLVRKLGAGGMGAVYEALQEAIERRVAIKILRSEYARDADITKRFFNEALAVNRIDHPSLVQIHEHGQLPDGTAYLVMELLKGETLAQRMRQLGGRLPTQQASQIMWQVAAALRAAHDKAIVHRDLKPANLMLVPDPLIPSGERVKVLDFGIAKLVADACHGTATSLVMGTPTYMSPEQCRGAGTVDEKTDVYSLGVVLFEMLVGRPPFISEGPGELMGMHLFQAPPIILELAPDIPAGLASFTHRLLSKDKSQRPSMREVCQRFTPLGLSGIVGIASIGGDVTASSSEPATLAELGEPTFLPASLVHSDPSGTMPLASGQHDSMMRPRGWRMHALMGSGVLAAVGLICILMISHRSATRSSGRSDNNISPVSMATSMSSSQNESSPMEPFPTAVDSEVRTEEVAGPSRAASHEALGGTPSASLSRKKKSSSASRQKHERLTVAASNDFSLTSTPNSSRQKATAINVQHEEIDKVDRTVLDKVLNDAQAAYVSGDYRKAIEMARKAQKDRPQPAFLLIGLAACRSKDISLADEAFPNLDWDRQRNLVGACLQQGIVRQSGVFSQASVNKASSTEENQAGLALDAAERSWTSGAYEQALKLAFRTVQSIPGPASAHAKKRSAWLLYGRAACKTHRLAAVESACEGLLSSDAERGQLVQVCKQLGITIAADCEAR